jgi:hypothetical protein
MVRTPGLLHIDIPEPGLGGQSLLQHVPHSVVSLSLLCGNHIYCKKLEAAKLVLFLVRQSRVSGLLSRLSALTVWVNNEINAGTIVHSIDAEVSFPS